MGTLRVRIGGLHGGTGGIETEVGGTKFTLHPLSKVLAMDLQFLVATPAVDKQANDFDLNQTLDLLQRNKAGNFDTVSFEFRIEEHSARTAMDQVGRHVLAAFWTWTARPSGHFTFPSPQINGS
jgi:hypothetical protein